MTEQATIYLVFGIIFSIGLLQIFLPGKVINLFAKWYGLWGMKVDRRHALWSDNTMRVMGVFYLACTGFLFYTVIQAR